MSDQIYDRSYWRVQIWVCISRFLKIGCYFKVFAIIHIYVFPVLKRGYYSDFKCMEKMLSESEATLQEKLHP